MPAQRARTNLVLPHTSFVGRAAALDEADAAIDRQPLITVVGSPGVGKTRFAVELGLRRAARQAHPGGVWLCDMSHARGPDSIANVVAHALEVTLTATAGRATVEQLAGAISARAEVLLVLDNFEHLVQHARASVGRWLELAPRARFLVTSREALQLPGEQVEELLPLSLPAAFTDAESSEAVQLFLARARTVRHGYVLGERDVPAVCELVHQLDGLPLAIELAAARMAVLGPAQLLRTVPSGLPAAATPAGRPAGARPARHATLQSAIDASWELLSADERSALAQATVFAGGFDADAAAAVIDLPGEAAPPVLDVLQTLREKSLLTTAPPADFPDELRFTMLATVREHAARKLEPLDRGAAEARHALYFRRSGSALAARADRGGDLEALRRLDLEAENLMAVHRRARAVVPPTEGSARLLLELALALEPVLSSRGPFAVRLDLLDAAVAAADATMKPDALVVRALLARADAAAVIGHATEAHADAARAYEAATETKNSSLLGAALVARGVVALRCPTGERAADAIARGIELLRVAGETPSVARASAELAAALIEDGDPAAAGRAGEQALALARRLGERTLEPPLAWVLALVWLERGDVAEAGATLRSGLEIARELGSRMHEASLQVALGWCEHDAGRYQAACTAHESALALARDLGDVADAATILFSLGAAAAADGRLDEAERRFDAAAHALRDGRRPAQRAVLERMLGLLDVARALSPDEAPRRLDHERAARRRLASAAQERTSFTARLAERWLRRALATFPAEASTERASTAVDGARREQPVDRARREQPVDRARREQPVDRARREQPVDATSPADALVIASTGAWFRPPRGARVSLHTRKPLRRVLVALAERRNAAPGRALPLEPLLRSGWPDDRISARTGAGRVHNAVTTLRKMGLRDLLLAREGGWLLDPEVALVMVEED